MFFSMGMMFFSMGMMFFGMGMMFFGMDVIFLSMDTGRFGSSRACKVLCVNGPGGGIFSGWK